MRHRGPTGGTMGRQWVLLVMLAACRTPADPGSAPLLAEEDTSATSEPSTRAEPEASPAVVSDEPGADRAPAAEPALAAEPTPAAQRGLTPLTEAQLDLLHGSVEDEVPEHRGGVAPSVENKHYLSSNEKALGTFFPTLDGVGGGYVGVGTDQGYLFTSWARFEVAWFIDYDPVIQQIHEIYRLLFAHAATPEQFLGLWDESARDEVFGLIDAEHEPPRSKQLRYWYRNGRGRIHNHLRRVLRHLQAEGIPSYLDDQERYDYVRRMLELRRVRPLLVNLLDDQGLAQLGRAAEALDVPVRVLYLSNAEQYWKRYTAQYQANIASLPVTDDAVLLRTITAKAANDDYRYNVQPIANYRQWMAQPFIRNVYQVVHEGPEASPEGVTFFRTDSDPAASPRGRRWRAEHPE